MGGDEPHTGVHRVLVAPGEENAHKRRGSGFKSRCYISQKQNQRLVQADQRATSADRASAAPTAAQETALSCKLHLLF